MQQNIELGYSIFYAVNSSSTSRWSWYRLKDVIIELVKFFLFLFSHFSSIVLLMKKKIILINLFYFSKCCLSSFMAICSGSVSPSSSTFIGAHIAICRARIPRTRIPQIFGCFIRIQLVFVAEWDGFI